MACGLQGAQGSTRYLLLRNELLRNARGNKWVRSAVQSVERVSGTQRGAQAARKHLLDTLYHRTCIQVANPSSGDPLLCEIRSLIINSQQLYNGLIVCLKQTLVLGMYCFNTVQVIEFPLMVKRTKPTGLFGLRSGNKVYVTSFEYTRKTHIMNKQLLAHGIEFHSQFTV